MPTPAKVVDEIIALLFRQSPPKATDRLLDPGCGIGAFIEGVIRWCERRKAPVPQIFGVESDPSLAAQARQNLSRVRNVTISDYDFLTARLGKFKYVVGNPPYVPITELSEAEKQIYRQRFRTAVERFDLYLLFFEQALGCLAPRGRLAFITPEKFMYVATAAPLRRLLGEQDVKEIRLLNESVFPNLVTYPTVTLVSAKKPTGSTEVKLRDGRRARVRLPEDGSSWLPAILQQKTTSGLLLLSQICSRISCGVATGADSIFVKETSLIDESLRRFAFPTISGRELKSRSEPRCRYSMLIPYSSDAKLLPIERLGSFRSYLEQPWRIERLRQRTCTAKKPWYSFHETPPFAQIFRPKILCKDITAKPEFWVDWNGEIVPRHSVYYIVPRNRLVLKRLADYLNSEPAHAWLRANCQRAANGFLRLQSHVLKNLPVPRDLAPEQEFSLPQQDRFALQDSSESRQLSN